MQTTIPKAVLFAGLLTVLAAPVWAQRTYTAASCNQNDVNAVINGPTHTAVDGDVIQIPSGACTWSSGIIVPNGIGITIQGSGTPNSDRSTTGASASCTATDITVTGTTFRATPSYGNSTMRISCMKLTAGGSAVAASILGSCTASGCPTIRLDNITFSGWQSVSHPGNSYGITAIGDVFGVIDHNTITGTAGQYLHLTQFSHASYLGVGLYGDNSWYQPEAYGSATFLFIENNIFNTAGCCENEGSAGGLTRLGGGRVVVRFNQFNNMDNLNFSMGWHGTETAGRPRSTRAFEYYHNTFACNGYCNSVAGARGGTGLVWGNAVDLTAGGLNSFFTMSTYRTQASIGPWGACDGSSPYDTNDGVTYWSGTVVSGGGTQTITVSGSPGWSTNQWVPNGAPYSLHDVTKNTGSEITANGSNTLTIAYTGGPGAWLPSNGDTIQILRATSCIDQAGGRGAGILYTATEPATPTSSANQVSSPTYIWSNTFTGRTPTFGSGASGTSSNTGRVIRNRDFYVENTNQGIQSNSTTPFDGTTTMGIGHGTLANRPTTCTAGVGYWAMDQGNWNQGGSGQGQLYVCTSPNTWTLYYTPYTYPHPLTTNRTAATSPAPPTNLHTSVN